MPATVTAGSEPREMAESASPASPSWYALYTQSYCEELVHQQLAARGFDAFLPKIDVWSRRGGSRHLIRIPMFPGYLFLHHAMDKPSHVEIRKARGLVRILGERWDRLAVVPDEEMEVVRRMAQSHLPALPHPYLREGRRVRITRGPLVDVEGILLRTKATKGLVVLSLDLLQRSVAVEIDCTHVVPL